MSQKNIIEELKQIRIRLTDIYYHKFGNPSNCYADSVLKEDINKFENNTHIPKEIGTK